MQVTSTLTTLPGLRSPPTDTTRSAHATPRSRERRHDDGGCSGLGAARVVLGCCCSGACTGGRVDVAPRPDDPESPDDEETDHQRDATTASAASTPAEPRSRLAGVVHGPPLAARTARSCAEPDARTVIVPKNGSSDTTSPRDLDRDHVVGGGGRDGVRVEQGAGGVVDERVGERDAVLSAGALAGRSRCAVLRRAGDDGAGVVGRARTGRRAAWRAARPAP